MYKYFMMRNMQFVIAVTTGAHYVALGGGSNGQLH